MNKCNLYTNCKKIQKIGNHLQILIRKNLCISIITAIKENATLHEENEERKKKSYHWQQCELNFILADIVLRGPFIRDSNDECRN